jgi:regulator of sigma E protease
MIFNALFLSKIYSILSILNSITLSLIGITSIIVFHEFGHFIFCKLFKVYTPTFSIGMGKKLYKKMIGDTEFCLSAAPLGGYVEIASEDMHGKKGFNSITYLQKICIMLGGIACNMIFAYIALTLLFFIGMPDSPFMPYENTLPIVQNIESNSKNNLSLKNGDIFIAILEQPITTAEEIKELVQESIKKNIYEISSSVRRNNEIIETTIHLNHEEKPMLLEQRMDLTLIRKSPLSLYQSVKEGITLTHFYIHAIFNSLKNIFSKNASQNLAGPIMTLASSTKVAQKGLKFLLFFLAIISINLGIMNLLPLPIFDGGQFVLFTIETIMKREMSESIKEKIGMASWFLVLGLMIIFSIKDIYTLALPYLA